MKYKILLSLFCLSTIGYVFGQDDEIQEKRKKPTTSGFDKNRMYVGGAFVLNAGGWDNSFVIGGNPEIGYTFAQWLDAGLVFNITSISQRTQSFGQRINNFIYGAGPYVRLYPFQGFFVQGGAEMNFLNFRVSGGNQPTYREKTQVVSLPVGIGWGQRIVGENSFYTSILLDLGTNLNSPYLNVDGSRIPIFRTGFIFYLGRNSGKRDRFRDDF